MGLGPIVNPTGFSTIHNFKNLIFKLKIGPKFENWFFKLGRVISLRFGRTVIPH
jgi:hypothetical protein